MIQFPNIDPVIVSITIFDFELALRWYALAYIVGILVAWWIASTTIKRTTLWPNNTPPTTPDRVEDLISYLIIGIIVGGRLGFVMFYQPAYYLAVPSEILQVWKGGMSFHGGFLGVVIAAALYFRKHNIPILSGADMIALSVPVGLFLGRVANFINGELWGRPTTAPWGVIFPGEAAQACGQAVGLCARHPSQLYEAVLEGLILGGVLIYAAYRTNSLKKPGAMTGLFFAGYGIARSIVELFRQPDAQFQSVENPLGYVLQIGSAGLTMGQILSIPMILVGLFLIFRSPNGEHR
jgi:phosphatidylglycerol:prolipoprotein diacylglycerol transferase